MHGLDDLKTKTPNCLKLVTKLLQIKPYTDIWQVELWLKVSFFRVQKFSYIAIIILIFLSVSWFVSSVLSSLLKDSQLVVEFC